MNKSMDVVVTQILRCEIAESQRGILVSQNKHQL